MIRYLEIVVFQVERNWAYAMECKLDTVDKPLSRKKFGMRQKLRKAVKWATFLDSLVEDNELVGNFGKFNKKVSSGSTNHKDGVQGVHRLYPRQSCT